MGCASSTNVHGQMGKSEKTIKAALLIQRWYRRYMARLETRRRATWSIFQTIEYAGEQDQFKLYNFFNTMVEQFSLTGENHGVIMKAFSDSQQRNLSNSPVEAMEGDEGMLRSMCDPDLFPVEIAYCGPRLNFPITRQQIRDLIAAFRDNQTLHVHYLLRLLHEARRVLRTLPNINRISSSLSGQVTVCGDLHGKLDDLYMIFQKKVRLCEISNHGLPEGEIMLDISARSTRR
ncbi:hypothetical protein RRG08_011028 [Elysia crispata]|uniref:protein-serine/threonine phosphatase n=1 Tax=Elysia crispata TaxID=231223 RepID=A0AAE0YDD1_9GAST|nr:hypothetical protein RRG08_011028 [Elysia crispata]